MLQCVLLVLLVQYLSCLCFVGAANEIVFPTSTTTSTTANFTSSLSSLFSSPVGIFTAEDTWYHEKLRNMILDLYNQFKEEDGSDNPTQINNEFFYQQQDAHEHQRVSCKELRLQARPPKDVLRSEWMYQRLWCSPEGVQMVQTAYAAVRRYLETFRIGTPKEDFLPSNTRNIFTWASVHHGYSKHSVHTHYLCTVSVVYYLSIPPESGSIGFLDPRGPRHPFGAILEHQPSEGDIVIFPSWMPHYVASSKTDSEDPRISIAFNLGASWKDLAMLTLHNVVRAPLTSARDNDDDA